MPGVSTKCHRVSLSTQTICGTSGKEQKAGLDSEETEDQQLGWTGQDSSST